MSPGLNDGKSSLSCDFSKSLTIEAGDFSTSDMTGAASSTGASSAGASSSASSSASVSASVFSSYYYYYYPSSFSASAFDFSSPFFTIGLSSSNMSLLVGFFKYLVYFGSPNRQR